MDLHRYRKLSPISCIYAYPIYALPFLYALIRDPKVVAILITLLSGTLYLSTFWTVKSLLFQCYRRNEKGPYVLHEGRLCRITKEKHGRALRETFMDQHFKYMLPAADSVPGKAGEVIKIAPRLDFTFAECHAQVSQPFYGLFPENSITVPNPTFLSLFKEQCVTPLFCFQVFSSILMCFDEYVMQSIFSTCMIVAVEAALVFSRIVTIKQFRKLEGQVQEIRLLKRGGSIDGCDSNAECSSADFSTLVPSDSLRPGDLVLIDQPIEIPCDLVICKGACAVDEAMLSGESVPLLKEALPSSSTPFDANRHRKHILFAGTRLERIDAVLHCRVIRTGFDTEQGALLCKMLSSEDIKYDTEALRFILILAGLSVVGLIFTWMHSSKTGYPLFIDLIVLFTSSIPFELPMEMGVAVQRAVRDLITKKIHCLEPFRITLAGKVDICCFDKTGTLTDAKLVLRSVVSETQHTNAVLSVCHGLVEVKGRLRGDPLDMAIHAHLSASETRAPGELAVRRQFAFSSEAKRHTVIAENADNQLICCVKGAPETVKMLLGKVPPAYDDYQKEAALGNRVIALAARVFPLNTPVSKPQSYYESNLEFAGFLIFGTTLKDHAVEMCRTLEESGHLVLMITGDNLLTAQAVARQLGIPDTGIEGKDIDGLLSAKDDSAFVSTRVFARAEPRHKEAIVRKHKAAGHCVMMVGDGTNDVGALKAADVGIAMLACPESPKENKTSKENKPIGIMQAFADESTIKPGDASVAAPFTIKSNSLHSVIEIIQQGRSSLVTTIQMYKILALNSITNAFFHSFTDILGLKFSEYQMIAIGILSAMAFQAISAGKPLPSISRQRPIATIFSRYILSSITLQSIVHIVAFILIARWVPAPAFATEFAPSIMNTIVFVVCGCQTISTFVCNYIGRPFRENIHENQLMVLSLIGLLAFIINVFCNIHSDLNNMLEVLPIGEYLWPVVSICIGDSIISYAAEKLCFALFMLK